MEYTFLIIPGHLLYIPQVHNLEMTSNTKRHRRHLEAALGEVERLRAPYRLGIEQLERSVRDDLTPGGCAQWFALVNGLSIFNFSSFFFIF